MMNQMIMKLNGANLRKKPIRQHNQNNNSNNIMIDFRETTFYLQVIAKYLKVTKLPSNCHGKKVLQSFV